MKKFDIIELRKKMHSDEIKDAVKNLRCESCVLCRQEKRGACGGVACKTFRDWFGKEWRRVTEEVKNAIEGD